MKNTNVEQLFKDCVKAGIFLDDKNGVTAFARLLMVLNTKYPGWRNYVK
tara:strand:+ start:420 stop:566 length:147 start_codon:yes stop_codon:yes gene_type:complete